MKKVFYLVFAVTALLTGLFTALAVTVGGELLSVLATTAGTTCYHFAMRLCIGFAVEKAMTSRKKVNFDGVWFREHKWEPKLYRLLRVRKWAKRVPTFKPEQFDARARSPEQLAHQTCLSELVHELIVVCGYFSLLFCLFFENPLANLAPFLITAILAGLYDMQFVILQRYNRPKILRLMRRKEERSKQIEKIGEK